MRAPSSPRSLVSSASPVVHLARPRDLQQVTAYRAHMERPSQARLSYVDKNILAPMVRVVRTAAERAFARVTSPAGHASYAPLKLRNGGRYLLC